MHILLSHHGRHHVIARTGLGLSALEQARADLQLEAHSQRRVQRNILERIADALGVKRARMKYKSEFASTPRLTPVEYLNDASWSRVPSLNSSIAHLLVSESPLHAFTEHPWLGGGALRNAAGTKPMQDGALIHKLLLGKGRDLAVIEAPDFRTKRARHEREMAFAAGKIPVLQHIFTSRAAVAARLRDRCAALGIEFNGESELVIQWTDDSANGPVRCRAMLDHAWVDRGMIVDVKTVSSANPRDCERHFVEYGMDLQWAAYTRALTRLVPEFEGRIDMVFLFMEIEPPYSVVPARPDGALREIGGLRWNRAVQLWGECLQTGEWPGYGNDRPVTLEAPPYVVSQEIGSTAL